MTTNNVTNQPELTTNGQLLIGSTSANPVAATLTAGTGITVTNGAGSITIASSGGGGGLTWLASATASTSSVINFNNILSSTYDNYLIVGENIVPDTSSNALEVQIGVGATPTYETSNYNGSGIASDDSSIDAYTSSSSYFLIGGSVAEWNDTSTNTGSIFLQITNINNASNYKTLTGQAGFYNETPTYSTVIISQAWLQATVLTSIRFQMNAGNILTGTFKIYGMQN
jgi:hypothetical protein